MQANPTVKYTQNRFHMQGWLFWMDWVAAAFVEKCRT